MTDETPAADFDSLWDFAQPAESEARFRERLAALPAGTDRNERAELLTQIARAQGLLRRFAAAHRTLDEASALAERDSRAAVRCRLERGRVHNSAGDAALAQPDFVGAFDLAMALGETALAVDAAHMVAIVESPDGALAWNRRAIALAEASDDPRARRWLPALANNVGWTHFAQGRFDEALRCFELALVHRQQAGAEPADIRVARWCVARAWRALGRLEAALVEQRSLVEEAAAAGAPVGYPAEEVGECLLALGRADEASPWFAAAWETLAADAWLRVNEPERLARLARLGNVPPPAA